MSSGVASTSQYLMKTFLIVVAIILLLVIAGGIMRQNRIRRIADTITRKPPSASGNKEPEDTTASTKAPYHPGFTVMDFPYTDEDGMKYNLTTAFWYPTLEKPSSYTYDTHSESAESLVAVDAQLVKSDAPFPIIFYAHGAYGCGFNGTFFKEYMASRGYIVVAPDYYDMGPPNFSRQMASCRIKDGNVVSNLRVLQAARDMKEWETNKEQALQYLTKYRYKPTAFLINAVLALNSTKESLFYSLIDKSKIGMMGHSLGGLTTLGMIGAYQFTDPRIKAALLFSAPTYPFEETGSDVSIPTMSMVGDNDEPMLRSDISRMAFYDIASPPKYYLILGNSDHLAFTDRDYREMPLYQAVEKDPRARAISEYAFAFFETHLLLKPSSVLNEKDDAWVYYTKQEAGGDVKTWGEEPEAGEGGGGGLRSRFRRR